MALFLSDLADAAMDLVGKPPIGSFDAAGTAEQRAIARNLDRAVLAALSRSHFTFARAVVTLAEAASNAYPERWAYAYDTPDDMVTFVRLVDGVDVTGNQPRIPHEIIGGTIYTNLKDAKARIIENSVDVPSRWSSKFFEAVSYLVAAYIAMPLTRKAAYRREMLEAYEMSILMAIEHDATQDDADYAWDDLSYAAERDHGTTDGYKKTVDGSIYWS